LGYVKSEPGTGQAVASIDGANRFLPTSVKASVAQLKDAMSLKDKITMANMQSNEIDHLNSGLSEYIKQNHGLYTGNPELMQSCAQVGSVDNPLPDEACAIILRALWEDLRKSHKLRVIK